MNPLDQIMGVQEAATMWNLSPDHVKRLCRDGKVIARNIGKTWIILKDQPNPKK
jgi:ribosomal protein L36